MWAHYINISYRKPAIGNPGLRGQKSLDRVQRKLALDFREPKKHFHESLRRQQNR